MSNVIDKILSDEIVVMTDVLIRAFKSNNCNPACHCCGDKIKSGDKFKLALVTYRPYWNYQEGRQAKKTEIVDEMLCVICTPKMLLANEAKSLIEAQVARTSGYTRKHIK